ncbi:MAG: tetratricopeptide repeat protein [Synechococcaceae cyanobacterium]
MAPMTHRLSLLEAARLLSAPLALLLALPVAALEMPPRPSSPDPGRIAQQQPEIPAEVQGWVVGAEAAYERGDPAQALQLQLQALGWVKARLAPMHPFRAEVLNNLGVYLSANGQSEEALAPTEEAVKIRRNQAKTNPAYLGALARSLTNLGVRYSELGSRQKALTATEEALKIRRDMAKTNPALQGDLAMALNNLGKFLSGMGRYQEALASTEEAVKIRRELAITNPAYLGDLAFSLNNLGVHYRNLGRLEEALPPTEEAVRIYRELAKTNPGYLRYLAGSLNNLGINYGNLYLSQKALATTEEAIRIYRELAKTNPVTIVEMAMSLNTLGYIQLQLGQAEIARNAYEESIAILRPLAARNTAFKENLQRTLNNLEELNRREKIRTGTQVLGAEIVSYLPKNDPTTPVKRAVVRLWPTFRGTNAAMGPLLGTGFVVRRQGDRAWIATALHVVRNPEDNGVATKVEAELFTGPLPPGLLPPRLEVMLNPSTFPERGDEPILLEVRGLPPDVQPLPLATSPPQGVLMIVGHPSQPGPWTVVRYPLLTSSEEALLLAGGLASGASGSPVLSSSQQVVGVVYDSPQVSKSRAIALTWAFPIKALAEKMK